MVANEAVLVTKLAADGAGGGLMSTIPEGMRGVTLRVNDVSGVSGFVVPGSRVDVILSGSPTSGNIEMAKTFLENIQVISAGQNIADDSGRPMNVQTVNVLVTPEQAEAVALAMASADGRLQLALRNPLDMKEVKPNGVRREHLFLGNTGSGSSTAPATPPGPAVRSVRTAPRQETKSPSTSPAPAVIAPPSPPEVMASPATRPKKKFELINGNKSETYEFDADTGAKSSGK
jgi:pilus assembly protein CpaB